MRQSSVSVLSSMKVMIAKKLEKEPESEKLHDAMESVNEQLLTLSQSASAIKSEISLSEMHTPKSEIEATPEMRLPLDEPTPKMKLDLAEESPGRCMFDDEL